MRGDQCPYDHGSDPVVLEDLLAPTAAGSQSPTYERPYFGGKYKEHHERGYYTAYRVGKKEAFT